MSFDNVYDIVVGLTPEGLEWLAFIAAGGILAFAVINAVVMSGAIYTWFERRALGRFQSRLGPNRWGPFGLFQPFADVLKLLSKEDVVPEPADRVVFHIAPLFLAIPVLLVFAVIPFGENSFLGRLNVGVLFIIGVTGVNTFGVFMGGYASRNKYALFGAMRGVAMLISYEVPMALALTGVALAAGSLALTDIVESQSIFFVVTQPLGFLVFMTAASAEMSRAPFDMIEAESEAGVRVPHGVQRHQVRGIPARRVPGAHRHRRHRDGPLPGRDQGLRPDPRAGLVRRQDDCGRMLPPLVQGDLAQAARGPDHGLRVEGPVPHVPAQHVPHCRRDADIPGRRRGHLGTAR